MVNVRAFYTIDHHRIVLRKDANEAAKRYILWYYGVEAKFVKLEEGIYEVTRKNGTKATVTVERTKLY